MELAVTQLNGRSEDGSSNEVKKLEVADLGSKFEKPEEKAGSWA